MQAVAHGLIGGALHGDVQRGVHAQAALVHRFGAVGDSKILANLFDEVRRQIVARILHVQAERRFPGGFFLGGRDLAFFLHAVQHQVAPRERARRIGQRRIISGRESCPPASRLRASFRSPTGLPK